MQTRPKPFRGPKLVNDQTRAEHRSSSNYVVASTRESVERFPCHKWPQSLSNPALGESGKIRNYVAHGWGETGTRQRKSDAHILLDSIPLPRFPFLIARVTRGDELDRKANYFRLETALPSVSFPSTAHASSSTTFFISLLALLDSKHCKDSEHVWNLLHSAPLMHPPGGRKSAALVMGSKTCAFACTSCLHALLMQASCPFAFFFTI